MGNRTPINAVQGRSNPVILFPLNLVVQAGFEPTASETRGLQPRRSTNSPIWTLIWWVFLESNQILKFFKLALNDHTSSRPVICWISAPHITAIFPLQLPVYPYELAYLQYTVDTILPVARLYFLAPTSVKKSVTMYLFTKAASRGQTVF